MKLLKALILIIFSVFIILAGIIFLIPTLASTAWGQNQIISVVNTQLPGTVSVKKMELSWFGKQKIEELDYTDPQQNLEVSIANLDTETPLVSLLQRSPNLGKTSVDHLYASVVQQEQVSSSEANHLPSRSPSLQLPFTGDLALHDANINITPLKGEKVSISNVNGEINIAKARDALMANLEGKTQQGNLSGDFEIDAQIKGFNPQGILELNKPGNINLKSKITNLPVDALALQDVELANKLKSLLGDKINLTIDQSTVQDKIHLVVHANSPTLQAEATGVISQNGTYTLETPAKVDFTLSPQALKTLLPPNNGFVLGAPTPFHLSINKLSFPINQNFLKEFMKSALSADLSANKVSLIKSDDGKQLNFDNLNIHITSDNLSEKIDLKVKGQVGGKNETGKNDFSMNTQIEDLLDASGKINYKNLSFVVDSQATHFPIVLATSFFGVDPKLNGQIDALIGEFLDLQITSQLKKMNGPFKGTITGSNGRFFIDGLLDNGLLKLKAPLTADLAVTPKLSQSVLKEFVPFLSSAIGADKPIKVVIDPKGFSFPLVNFDRNQVMFDQATVDLGKIKFSQKGSLGALLSLLKADTETKHLNVWFTPLFLKMRNGNAQLSRMDMLVMDRFPIALWGDINFPQDKVNLTVGLSAQTLSKAFGIKGMDDKYMMTLPLAGTLNNATIDKTKALAKISGLVAQGQGSTKGLIIGGVLGILGGGNEKVPPPTTTPFPWSKDKQDQVR